MTHPAEAWHVEACGSERAAAGEVVVGDLRPDHSSTARWYNVVWRGRVLDSSWGDVEGRLRAVADAMRGCDGVYGTPVLVMLGDETFSVEVWIGAADARAAIRSTRLALQRAFAHAGVSDSQPGATELDVMLMLEEWPLVRRSAP